MSNNFVGNDSASPDIERCEGHIKGGLNMFIAQKFSRACLGFFLVSLLGWQLGTGATAQAQAHSKPQPAKPSEQGKELQTLLKERRAVTEKVVTILTNKYQQGVTDFPKLAQAELDALKAILDDAESPEKRVASLRQYQKTAEGIMQNAEARFLAGAGTEVDALQAKAILLAVRIELLREEQKAKLLK